MPRVPILARVQHQFADPCYKGSQAEVYLFYVWYVMCHHSAHTNIVNPGGCQGHLGPLDVILFLALTLKILSTLVRSVG